MKKCDNSDDLYLYSGNIYRKVQFIAFCFSLKRHTGKPIIM